MEAAQGDERNMAIPVDVTFHAGWWHANAGVGFNSEFFLNPRYRIESDIRMRKVLFEKFGNLGLGDKNPAPRPIIGSDLLASGYLFSQIMGCEVRFFEDGPPEVLCANLTDDQAANYKAPELSGNACWQQTMKQFEELKDTYGYVESHINLQGVQNLALDLRGSELFIDYIENPEIAERLIRESALLMLESGRIIKKYSRVLSHGVTAITKEVMPEVYLTSNCTVEMISEEIYEDFLLAADTRLAEEFRPFGIHHCGKSMEHVADGYRKVKGLDFAEVGAGSDIKKVRAALPEVYLNLRYSPVKLKTVSLGEMERELEKMAADAETNFSISCVGIDVETDDGQIENFLKSVKSLKS
jgi:hypothetical protein